MNRNSSDGRFPNVFRGSFGSQRARSIKKAPLNDGNNGSGLNESTDDNFTPESSPEKGASRGLSRGILVALRKALVAWTRLRPWLRYEQRNLRVLYSALGKRNEKLVALCFRTLADLRREWYGQLGRRDLIAQTRGLTRHGNKTLAMTVIEQASVQLASSHFHAWIGLIRRNNKLVRTVLDLANRTTLALCSRCFRLWVVAFFDWVRLRELVAELILRVSQRWTRTAFTRWAVEIETERQLLDIGTKIIVRWCGKLTTQAFNGWYIFLGTRKQARALRQHAIEACQSNAVVGAFARLKTNAEDRRTALLNMAQAFGVNDASRAHWAMDMWRSHMVAGEVEAVKTWFFRSLTLTSSRRRLLVSWTIWCDVLNNAKTRRTKRKKVEHLVALHLCAMMWSEWTTFAARQSHLFESATQVLLMYDHAVQRRHLQMWRTFSSTTQRLKFATVQVMDTALTTAAGRAFMDWKWHVRRWNRIYRRVRKMARKYFVGEGILLLQEWRWLALRRKRMDGKIRAADARCTAFMLPPVFLEWRRRVHLRERTFTICERNRRRGRARLSLSTFEEWQFGFRTRRKLQTLLGRLSSRLTKRQLLCIVIAWHAWACQWTMTAKKLLATRRREELQLAVGALRRYAYSRVASRNRAASVTVGRMASAVQRWQAHMGYLAHLQNMFYQAVFDSSRSTQRKVLRAWVLRGQTGRVHRRAARVGERHWRELLQAIVVAWANKSAAYQALVRTELRGARKQKLLLQKRYLRDWRSTARDVARLRNTERRLGMTVSARALASSFLAWGSRSWRSGQVKRLLRDVVSGREDAAIDSVMLTWMEATRRGKHERMKKTQGELSQCLGELAVLSEQLVIHETTSLEFQAQRGQLEAEILKSRESEAVAMKVVELMRTTEEGANGRINDLLARVGDANHVYQRLELAQESARVLEGRRKELVAHVQLLERELDAARFEQDKMRMELESAWKAMEARRDEVGKEAVDTALRTKEVDKANAELLAKLEVQNGELEALLAKHHKITIAQAQAEAARNVAQRSEKTLRGETESLKAELRTKEASQQQMLRRMKELEEALDGERRGVRGLVTLVDGEAELLEGSEEEAPERATTRLGARPLETEAFQAEVGEAQGRLKAVMQRVRELEGREVAAGEEQHQLRVRMAEQEAALRAEGAVVSDLRLLLKETRAAHAAVEEREGAQRRTLGELERLLRTVVTDVRGAELEVGGLGDALFKFMEREQELRAEGEAAGRERGEQYYRLLLKAEAALAEQTSFVDEAERTRREAEEEAVRLRRELEEERVLSRKAESGGLAKIDEGREELVEVYRRQAEDMAREQQRLLEELERQREAGRVRAELESAERVASPVPLNLELERQEALSAFHRQQLGPFLQRRLARGSLDRALCGWLLLCKASSAARAAPSPSSFHRPQGASQASWTRPPALDGSAPAAGAVSPQAVLQGSPHAKSVPVRSRLDMQPITPAPSPLPASEANSEAQSPRTGQLSHRSTGKEGSDALGRSQPPSSPAAPPPPPRVGAGQPGEVDVDAGGPGQFPEWWMHRDTSAASSARDPLEQQAYEAQEKARIESKIFSGTGAGNGAETSEEEAAAEEGADDKEGSQTWTRAPLDPRPGFIGMSITKETPHIVLAVEDVLDENRRRQGEAGYNNPTVMPGDILRAVAGVDVMAASAGLLSDHIAGQSNSVVTLMLSRPSGEQYEVRVMRHSPAASPGRSVDGRSPGRGGGAERSHRQSQSPRASGRAGADAVSVAGRGHV